MHLSLQTWSCPTGENAGTFMWFLKKYLSAGPLKVTEEGCLTELANRFRGPRWSYQPTVIGLNALNLTTPVLIQTNYLRKLETTGGNLPFCILQPNAVAQTTTLTVMEKVKN